MWQRALLSVIAAIALATATFAPAIAAGSSAHQGATQHRAAQATCKTVNKPTGTIKYSDWQFPDTLNIYQTGASVSLETINIMIEALGLLNPKAHLLMDVLQSVKASNGGRVFTATVRKGLRWSNGQALTSADIKFAWQIYTNPDSGPYAPSIGADVISRIDTPNPYTAVFHMKTPFAPFYLETLPGFYPWPVSWPGAWAKGDVKAATDKLFQDQTFNFEGPTFPTNGPYQVAPGGFVQNDRITLQPMKYYRTLACGARIKTPIFVFYSDKPGLIAAAASRQTDLTQNYTPADLAQLVSHSSQFKTAPTPAYEVEHLTLNTDATALGQKNPLHDVRVRLALALSLNKLSLIQSALDVSKSVAKQLISWSPLIVTPRLVQPYADTKLQGQWDPLQKKYITNTGSAKADADAKKLLAQAGYSNGFTVQGLTTSGNPTRAAEFASMARDWLKIGVKFVPNYIPASKLFADWNAGAPPHLGTFQIAMWTDVANPDPDYYHTSFQSQYIDREKTVHSAINANYAAIKNKLIDEAFAKGATTLNKKTRAHWYQIWQEQVNKNAYWIMLYYRTDVSTSDGALGNYSPNGTGQGFSWNAFEWYDKGLK
jgi:peptide/nickel transport system substrate-binding protein